MSLFIQHLLVRNVLWVGVYEHKSGSPAIGQVATFSSFVLSFNFIILQVFY